MSNPKELRKQLRNVIQDMKDELLTQELSTAIEKKLYATINMRLTALENHVKSTLDQIDNRSKDLQSYVLRQSLPVAENKQAEVQSIKTS